MSSDIALAQIYLSQHLAELRAEAELRYLLRGAAHVPAVRRLPFSWSIRSAGEGLGYLQLEWRRIRSPEMSAFAR